MRFPNAEQLSLPCRFARVVQGALHPDGRRYLPQIVLALAPQPSGDDQAVTELGVVDRHHRVNLADEGRDGVARLVFLLSRIHLQTPPYRKGLFAEAGRSSRSSTRPLAFGQVAAVPTWEAEQEHLPYESLYTELLLDIGIGIIGVRTNATAISLAAALGKARIEPGDWLAVERSRIDILGFE